MRQHSILISLSPQHASIRKAIYYFILSFAGNVILQNMFNLISSKPSPSLFFHPPIGGVSHGITIHSACCVTTCRLLPAIITLHHQCNWTRIQWLPSSVCGFFYPSIYFLWLCIIHIKCHFAVIVSTLWCMYVPFSSKNFVHGWQNVQIAVFLLHSK